MSNTQTLTHRRHSDSLNEQHVMLFADVSEDDQRNASYGEHVWTLVTELPAVPDHVVAYVAEYYECSIAEARELVDPENIVSTAGAWDNDELVYEIWAAFEESGYRTQDGAVVLDKTAVELTYHLDDE
jgi:hypothetical protein